MTTDPSSEYDNIPISAELVEEMGYSSVLENAQSKAIKIKEDLETVRDQRANTKDKDEKELFSVFTTQQGHNAVYQESKIELLENFLIATDTLIKKILTNQCDSTNVLDYLDVVLHVQNENNRINEQVSITSKTGPIVDMLEVLEEKSLDFLEQVVTQNQKTSPKQNQ